MESLRLAGRIRMAFADRALRASDFAGVSGNPSAFGGDAQNWPLGFRAGIAAQGNLECVIRIAPFPAVPCSGGVR